MHHPMQAEAARPKPRPALRLVSTKDLSRDEWLAVRKQGIGSSDAAAAIGISPWKSPLELWLEKTGQDAQLPKPDPNDDTSPLYWGTLLEPVVASHYSKRTGHKVRRINAVLQHPDPALSWMLANLDREVIGAEDVQILECKTAGIHSIRQWRDGVPEYIQVQVQHQLAVSGKAAADVAVLMGGQELQIHRIERNDVQIAALIRLELAFWQFVETYTPPPPDGSASAETALRCLYPQDHGRVADFREDRELSRTLADLLDVRTSLTQLEAQESALKQRIQQAMGDASRALFETGEVSWKRSKDSVGLDVARLLEDQPELLLRYPQTKAGSRRFLVL